MIDSLRVQRRMGLNRILGPDLMGQLVVARGEDQRWRLLRAWVRAELPMEDVQAFGRWAFEVLDELAAVDDPVACGWTASVNHWGRWYLNAPRVA